MATRRPHKSREDFARLLQRLFAGTSRPSSPTALLETISGLVREFSGCDAVVIWLREPGGILRFEQSAGESRSGISECLTFIGGATRLEKLCLRVLAGSAIRPPGVSAGGSFWTGNAWSDPRLAGRRRAVSSRDRFRSLAVIPIGSGEGNLGLLKLKSERPRYFRRDEIVLYEMAARAIGFALGRQRTQAALQERVKELTCLYGISQLCQREGASVGTILQGVVELLPSAWQFPEVARARIDFDGQVFATPGYRSGGPELTAEIAVNGTVVGTVRIAYLVRPGDKDFLLEEQNLLGAVAASVGLIIQRKLVEDEQARLAEQLRHADRMATIGQLAAGIAHELNEPLATILGFAQMVKKSPGLSGQAGQDVDKIIRSSLHSREIIRRLVQFGRQTPLQKKRVNLNQLVEDGLYFIEARAASEGIGLCRELDPRLPEIEADYSQVQQVLVNLMVNAIQAMPGGGRLSIRTTGHHDHVCLIVEDTGTGMDREQLAQIWNPFYTTKAMGQGTGLGLPVVNDIINSHHGSIQVRSRPGRGTRFKISLPR